jgi:hypothetical protein
MDKILGHIQGWGSKERKESYDFCGVTFYK